MLKRKNRVYDWWLEPVGAGYPARTETGIRSTAPLSHLRPFDFLAAFSTLSECLHSFLCSRKAMQVFQETSFKKVGINNQGSVSSDSKDIYSCGQPCTVLGFALVWWGGGRVGGRDFSTSLSGTAFSEFLGK